MRHPPDMDKETKRQRDKETVTFIVLDIGYIF